MKHVTLSDCEGQKWEELKEIFGFNSDSSFLKFMLDLLQTQAYKFSDNTIYELQQIRLSRYSVTAKSSVNNEFLSAYDNNDIENHNIDAFSMSDSEIFLEIARGTFEESESVRGEDGGGEVGKSNEDDDSWFQASTTIRRCQIAIGRSRYKRDPSPDFERIFALINKYHPKPPEEKHTHQPKFVCDICGKIFTKRRILQRHKIRAHEEGGDYKCGICRMEFSTQSARSAHELSHYEGHVCDICGMKFRRPQGLKRHQWHSHGKGGDCRCSTCKKNVSNGRKGLINEKRDRGKFTLAVCDICGKKCRTKKLLKKHKMSNCSKNRPTQLRH